MKAAIPHMRKQIAWLEQEEEKHYHYMFSKQEPAYGTKRGDMMLQQTEGYMSFADTLSWLFQETSQVSHVLWNAQHLLHSHFSTDSTSSSSSVSHRLSRLYMGCKLDWIGLEYHCGSPTVRHETKARREALWEVVSDIQSEYEQGLWTVEGRNEELADSCRQLSQPHALYAQLIAHAQRQASAVFDE